MQKVLTALKTQSVDLSSSPDALNIILIGRTGSGKSYFGNSLLGNLTPGRRENVPFSAGESSSSVTQSVKARSGLLFGGLYDKELGLTKPLKINVFDTPGFADADIGNIRKNKLLIGTSIRLKYL